MEFKKQYTFMIFLLFIVMFSIIFAGCIALITWMIVYGVSTGWESGVIVGIVCIGICAVGALALILVFSQWVTIDEEKIELKTLFRGVYLSFKINDIYKIEKKPGGKGILVFVIHGSTQQFKERKIKTINFWINNKNEKILRHFITNPDVWVTETISSN